MYTYFIKYKTQHDTTHEYVFLITREFKLKDNKDLLEIVLLIEKEHGVNIDINITHISLL